MIRCLLFKRLDCILRLACRWRPRIKRSLMQAVARTTGTILVALIMSLRVPPAQAGHEPEQRQMIFPLAAAAGYNREDAKIISDGSWSMDENPSTAVIQPTWSGKIED